MSTPLQSRIPSAMVKTTSTPLPSSKNTPTSLRANFERIQQQRGLFSATKSRMDQKRVMRERLGKVQRVGRSNSNAPQQKIPRHQVPLSPEFGTPAIHHGSKSLNRVEGSRSNNLCHDVFADNDAFGGIFSPILGNSANGNTADVGMSDGNLDSAPCSNVFSGAQSFASQNPFAGHGSSSSDNIFGQAQTRHQGAPFTGIVARSPNVFDDTENASRGSFVGTTNTRGIGSTFGPSLQSFSIFNDHSAPENYTPFGQGNGTSHQTAILNPFDCSTSSEHLGQQQPSQQISLEEQRWQAQNTVKDQITESTSSGFGSSTSGSETFGSCQLEYPAGGSTAHRFNPFSGGSNFGQENSLAFRSSQTSLTNTVQFASAQHSSTDWKNRGPFNNNPFGTSAPPSTFISSSNTVVNATTHFNPTFSQSQPFSFCTSDADTSPITPESALNTAFTVFEDTPLCDRTKRNEDSSKPQQQPFGFNGLRTTSVNAPVREQFVHINSAGTPSFNSEGRSVQNTFTQSTTNQFSFQPISSNVQNTFSFGSSSQQNHHHPAVAPQSLSQTHQEATPLGTHSTQQPADFAWNKENQSPACGASFVQALPENQCVAEHHADPYNDNQTVKEHLAQLSSFESPKPRVQSNRAIKMPPRKALNILCERSRTDTEIPISKLKNRGREDHSRLVSFTREGVRNANASHLDLDNLVPHHNMTLSTEFSKIYRVQSPARPVSQNAAGGDTHLPPGVVRPMVIRRIPVRSSQ
uniref:Uncharacterized protein n=1 Tax=Percolomonas cosmopolitus TaxID=63605 RepID=A0A7S1PJK3_9EUKA|eukprot:CAMPEP_0117453900 /NCGR_PEP_ID=MMETSP0759-20121206/10491_1 /TAXON_ID=63605 /ORGANISM="Percolomonas cosmopolitus, Strain WS" /LENGTH=748 /DNA_ID=CAMNT_0005247005 /DNA_START=118 /DNA_END=2364 /DNA_ORIENTATION=-